MVIAALIAGSGMDAGVLGVIVILLIAGLFGGAYSGIGIFVAMRTGNAQAAQASFLIFFPLLFMAPAFAPMEVFQDWLQFIASINPVTYIMEGMRTLVLEDYEGQSLVWSFLSLFGFGAVTLSMAVFALQARTRAG